MTRTRKPGISRRATLAMMGAGAVTFATPWVARAQAKTIKVGMPTILSGRVAQLGTSSRNAVMLEVEKVNAAGGLAGRQIEMVIRDSKGQPQEAARVARELVNTDGCEILIDAEASSGAFAVHEVARDLGVLCIHTNSETSALTADPKQHIPNAFRTARQGVHDSIVGGSYAAAISKAKGLKKWATCSPDYAYGRDTTGEFTTVPEALCARRRDHQRVLAKAVPARLHRSRDQDPAGQAAGAVFLPVGRRPHVLYRSGQHLRAVQPDGGVRGQHGRLHRADGGEEPAEGHSLRQPLHQDLSGDRRRTRPGATPTRRNTTNIPTNWSWENATAIMLLAEASKKANSADGKKIAEAMRGLKIKSPFGADGTVTMRAEDQTLVGYAIGWGTTIPQEPYVPQVQAGDWKTIFELEAEWKKSKGYT